MTLLVLMMTAVTAWAQHQPVGDIVFPVDNWAVDGGDGVLMKGWAYDPDAPATSIGVRIDVYTDQDCQSLFKTVNADANENAGQVSELEGIEGYHGFSQLIEGLSQGATYWVKVFASDATGDGEAQIGSTKEMTVVIFYDLYVGGTQVTTSNKEDILGDGKASYDPDTYTLTLNSPTISLDEGYGILVQNMDLTITGTWHMTDAAEYDGIKVEYGNLTLNGNFTLKGGESFYGINVEGSDAELTIASGSTIFASGGSAGISCANIIVCNGVRKIEAQGLDDGGSAYLGNFAAFPEGYGFIVNETKRIIIGRNTSYGIYLGNTPVTPTNKDDILGDGKATYDPETSTLTLNEPEVTNMYFTSDYGYCNLYVADTDITITGAWHMDADNDRVNGILVEDGNVTLDGNFKFVGSTDSGIKLLGNSNLTLKGDIEAVSSGNWGIHNEEGSITVSSGHLKATGAYAIIAHDVTIESGVTKVELDGTDVALRYTGDLTLGDGISITDPLDGLPYNGFLYNLDGEVLTSAVIEPSDHPIPQVPGTLMDLGWLGNTKINSWNVSDKSDGKVSYDAETKTLTFDNPIISGVHDNAKIYLEDVDINLVGSYHMTEAEAEYGIYISYGSLTLDGDFTFYGSTSGISSNHIIVKSGTVNANGTWSAIYSQLHGVTILGGSVNATGLTYGIRAIDGDIAIYGGNVNIVSQTNEGISTKDDINHNGDVAIYGGNVKVVSQSDYGIKAAGTITLGWTSLDDYIYSSSFWSNKSVVKIADGQTLYDEDGNPFTGNNVSIGNGKTLRSYVYRLSLNDAADNGDAIEAANGRLHEITLTGRTLYTDGDWNTLTLPFALDNFTGTPMEGATVMTLGSTDFSAGTLTMDFTEVTSIAAGRPYIVKWQDGVNMTIGSAAEWDAFAESVNGGKSFAGKTVMLTSDISSVATMAGTAEHPFRGTFEGAGHTMNMSICDGGDGAAPFHYISGATIRNVKTTGTVSGGNHSAGLVGIAQGGTNSIRDCYVDATVSTSGSYVGGILGNGTTSTTTISNCLFGGSIAASNMGILYGWGEDGGTHKVENCVASGTYGTMGNIDLLLGNGNRTVTNCWKNTYLGSQGDNSTYIYTGGEHPLVTGYLGSQWTYDNGFVLSPTVSVLDENIVNPVFLGVTVDATPSPVETTWADFVGTYEPMSFSDADKSILFLGTANTLYYPVSGAYIGALRAFFQLKGIEAGDLPDPNDPNLARRFVLNFGEGDHTTGIIEVEEDYKTPAHGSGIANSLERDAWYSVDGRQLVGKPTAKGIYINNGKKVVIK